MFAGSRSAVRMVAMLLGAWCLPLHAEQLFVAHYQFDLLDHELIGTTKSQFRIRHGESAKTEVFPDYMELSVEPVSAQEYDLHVILTPARPPAQGVRLDRKFHGRFGVPLEINAQGDALKLTGAISVAVVEGGAGAGGPTPTGKAP